ncbi:MAG: SMP-30/gluconolactonase/LRE family protein [Methylophaga sp.]|nr:SMP-30/gluconolactonase/LRE family protein [Methylophaga sp.]
MNRILGMIVLLLPIISSAASPILLPAWQTETVFDQPESVVYDAKRKQLYVSNVNGNPTEAAGNGYISLLSVDGKIIDQHWIDGLNAPKGMTIVDGKLYIADINELVVVNIKNQKIIQHYSAPKAKFLNDVAADGDGNIYVSGFLTNSIYRLHNGKFELWMQSDQLEVPNGLLVEGNQLLVASWGNMTDGFATAIPGHIKTIDLASKKIKSLGDASPAGNLDGLESDANGNYYVTDWMAGTLLHITPAGISKTLVTLRQGSADHTVLAEQHLIIIPMMNSGYLTAYKIKENP